MRHIVIVAPPKSGSTFLANVLSEALNWPVEKYANRQVNDYTFDLETAKTLVGNPAVIHVHSLRTGEFARWLQAYNIEPIVLHRDIKDSIVSMYDHKVKRQAIPRDYALAQLPFDQGVTEVAFEWAHWYRRFDTSWRTFGTHFQYDEVVNSTYDVCRKILDTSNVACEDTMLYAAIDSIVNDLDRANFNVGRPGRGRMLPRNLQKMLEDLKGL